MLRWYLYRLGDVGTSYCNKSLAVCCVENERRMRTDTTFTLPAFKGALIQSLSVHSTHTNVAAKDSEKYGMICTYWRKLLRATLTDPLKIAEDPVV